MCDQPSLHYTLYLLVQIFANYDNLPLDLYGLIEAEVRKLYYHEEKTACVKHLKTHIAFTLGRYEKVKKFRVDNWGSCGVLPYIMPMRYTLVGIYGKQILEDVIVDTTYYINGYRIHPYDSRKNIQNDEYYGFDIHSKEDFVAMLDDQDSEEYYNSFEDYYYISPYGDYNILKKIIRNQMILEECKIQMK